MGGRPGLTSWPSAFKIPASVREEDIRNLFWIHTNIRRIILVYTEHSFYIMFTKKFGGTEGQKEDLGRNRSDVRGRGKGCRTLIETDVVATGRSCS